MKLEKVVFAAGVALAVVGIAVLVYELTRTDRPAWLSGGALDRVMPPAKAKLCDKSTALTAPTLAAFYDYARGQAASWKPDTVPARLDHLAMSSPLAADGSSRMWTAGFYSPSAKSSLLVHTGDGTVNCSTVKGMVASNLPRLTGEPMRDGAALYRLAEKHGKPFLAKGLGVGIYLWARGDDNHAAWHIGYYDKQGNQFGPLVVVNASTGAVEDIVKSR